MMVHQQQHGYVAGHQLLASSVALVFRDKEAVDRLSDMAGSLGPGEQCPPYLTGYPLPSGAAYVIARTWYDDKAPRAGCVITHSLLVGMDEWESLRAPGALVGLFNHFEKARGRRSLDQLSVPPPRDCFLPPVIAPERTSVVEALFLEQRAPIVWFDSPDAENAALRVVQALWPSLRRTFSFCTYALQPRALEGRDFDFLCAPKEARPRFADWQGRRIDRHPGASPRHRWSDRLAAAVFESPHPSLTVEDPLGLLRRDRGGDAAALRLTVLWSELRERTEESPSALLAMVDVLASVDLPPDEVASKMEPIVLETTHRASTMPPHEGFDFLRLLIAKMTGRTGRVVANAVRDAAFNLALVDGLAGFGAAADDQHSPLSRALCRGIGDALAEQRNTTALASLGEPAREETASSLLAWSKAFASVALSLGADGTTKLPISSLVRIISNANAQQRRRLTTALLPFMMMPQHEPLIALLMRDASPFRVRWGLRALASAGGLRQPVVARAFIDAVRHEHIATVRDGILSLGKSVGDQVALLELTLRQDDTDLAWLLDESRIDANARPQLLGRYIDETPERSLGRLAGRRPDLIDRTIDVLVADSVRDHAVRVARLLPESGLAPERTLSTALDLMSGVPAPDGTALAAALLPRVSNDLAVAGVDVLRSFLLADAVASAVASLGGGRAVDCFVPRGPSGGEPQSVVLAALVGAHPEVKRVVVERFDEVVRRLERRPRDDLTGDGIAAWADLLSEFVSKGTRGGVAAAATTLDYAFHRPRLPVSALVVCAFHVVHEAASAPDSSFELGRLVSYWDWDKAKALRKKLITVFIESRWPPGDLVVAAERAGVARQILRRVARKSWSEPYLAEVKRDLAVRTDPSALGAARCLADWERQPDWSEWD